ncbi:phenylacetate--CoA ligase family protein [Exiguobacterium qingdaonense]|uniref:phenylacetate--CoA ligase family protein n=1 Tax=Exiguobacterium qingdaonense TaxID=2751251 RepID=UPI001BED1237|nr:phenylacetate--CoA ligase family protein [Exiguobacterium qingdaonense]
MGILQDQLYAHSPIRLQNWLISLYGIKLYRERYGQYYEQELERLRRDPNEAAPDASLKHLNEFLQFCAQHNAYYKRLFKEHGITLPLESLEDFKRVPPLEKETLRTDETIFSDLHAPIIGVTGGTTGKSIQVRFTEYDYQIRMAHLDYFKEQHGFYRGMKRASFTGRMICPRTQKNAVYWRYNAPMKQMLYSAVHSNPMTIPHYIDSLNEFRPVALDGSPSDMIEIAKYLKTHQKTLAFRPIALFPTSETLTPSGRSLLEEMFQAPVYDQYASSEGAPIVTECEHGKMHLRPEMGIIETDDSGEAFVTSFTTHGTPLVRYRIGDRMTISEATCSCGRRDTIIESIDGRQMNYVETPEGYKVFEGDLTAAVGVLPNSIIQIQVLQHKIDEIEMLYVKDEARFEPGHEVALRQEVERLFTTRMNVFLREVKSIQKEGNGKVRVVKRLYT